MSLSISRHVCEYLSMIDYIYIYICEAMSRDPKSVLGLGCDESNAAACGQSQGRSRCLGEGVPLKNQG